MAIHEHESMSDWGHRGFLFDADFDVADAFKIVITTPATGSYWLAEDVSSSAVCNVSIKEAIVNVTGDGTALTLFGRSRQGDYPNVCACAAEYGGTYTGGTEILSKVEMRAEVDNHTLMKPSTSYLITVTSKADNNYTSVIVWVWEA